jgi:phage gpG-like protein
MTGGSVNVQVRGIQEVQAAIRAFGAAVEKGVSDAIAATALETLTDVRKAIQGPPKTGREYPRGKDGSKIHRASAPGQAPATDTGALVSSTYFTKVNDLTAAIGSRLDYAFFLEFGTLRMEPRPSWVPAAERNAPRLEKRLRRVIAEARAKAERTTK